MSQKPRRAGTGRREGVRGGPKGVGLLRGTPRRPPPLPTVAHVVFQCLRGRPLHGQQSGVRALGIDPGQAEIADFGHVLLGDEDVARSQVPVHQLLGLQVVHALGHIPAMAKRSVTTRHRGCRGLQSTSPQPRGREGDRRTHRANRRSCWIGTCARPRVRKKFTRLP